MSEDGRLLRQYREQGSQAAFARLAARHLGFVYATCLRETGDAALAEDAAQVVFLLLARRAPALRPEQSLSGWLFQTARFAARNARRREARRRTWEERAMQQTPPPGSEESALWDRLGPAINDALAALGAKDREAVLLRFADGLSFPELGAALGTSEDAARMRLNRALGRLRQFFAKQGVTLSVAALAGLLAARTVQAAPAACAAAVAGIGGGAPTSPSVHLQLQGVQKAMTISKLKLAASVAVGAALTGSLPFVTRAQNYAKNIAAHTKARPTASARTARLPRLELGDDFTITYRLLLRDVRTPAMKEADTRGVVNSYQIEAKQGAIRQADADRNIRAVEAQANLPRPPQQYLVTLSAHQGRLLYVSQQYGAHSYGLRVNDQPEVEPYQRQVVLYDGRKTYAYHDFGSQSRLEIKSGLRTQELMDCLLPGLGLPTLPLARPASPETANKSGLPPATLAGKPSDGGLRCDVLRLHIANPDANAQNLYWPGEAYLQGSGTKSRLTKLASGLADRPEEVWTFQQPQAFQGSYLSRHTHWMENRIYVNGEPAPVRPRRVADYQVTSAKESPLPIDSYDIRTYLKPGTVVNEDEQDNGQGHQYRFDPNGGDLAAQRQAADAKTRPRH